MLKRVAVSNEYLPLEFSPRVVPPTEVTFGSEAGKSGSGFGVGKPLAGVVLSPKSPDEK